MIEFEFEVNLKRLFVVLLSLFVICLGAIPLIWMVFCAYEIAQQPKSELQKPPQSTNTIATPKPIRPVITQSQYAQLQSGMSYRQVVNVLGVSGEELSRNQIAGYENVMYQWMNPGLFSGGMNAMFQNDCLIQKSQYGLPP